MSRNKALLFACLILISFVLMTLQSKQGPLITTHLLKDLLNTTYALMKAGSEAVKLPFEIMFLRKEENVILKKHIDELLLERKQYQTTMLENRRLKELLDLRIQLNNYVTTASVIARSGDRWRNTVGLDKGKKDGVLKDMAALTPRGLAGKIITASDSYAELLLLTDIHFSASVRLQESRQEGILSGTGTRKCVLKYISPDEKVMTGDVVVTSGLDSLFPRGIPVGYISEVQSKPTRGHFQYIEVIPFQSDTKLEEVIIVR